MIPFSKVQDGVARYADREIISKLPTGTPKRVLAGTALAVVLRRGENILQNSTLRALGVTDGENVDIDLIADTLKEQMLDGLTIDAPGGIHLVFHSDDIDAIRRDILGVSQ